VQVQNMKALCSMLQLGSAVAVMALSCGSAVCIFSVIK
jgi:hypothetical protein